MKKIVFLFLAVLTGALAPAQTNTPANGAAPRSPTEINSDAADFDLNARLAVYRGHVMVNDPQNHIEAQTNVVIDFSDSHGQTAHATGALAVYRYFVQNGATNETVTLTGSPQVESPQGTMTGSKITWDRANNGLHVDDPRMISKQNLNEGFGTNSSPLKLF
jgi:lipopolysaccharide transport protein LptA